MTSHWQLYNTNSFFFVMRSCLHSSNKIVGKSGKYSFGVTSSLMTIGYCLIPMLFLALGYKEAVLISDPCGAQANAVWNLFCNSIVYHCYAFFQVVFWLHSFTLVNFVRNEPLCISKILLFGCSFASRYVMERCTIKNTIFSKSPLFPSCTDK